MTGRSSAQSGIKKYKILIVDDHPIVRQGLAALLSHEPDMEVCGGAEDVSEAIQQVEANHPDLVVIDISLKSSHGLELISKVKARDPQIRMLVWSMFDEKVFAERTLRAGAMGYINKQESIDKVVDAIRHVLEGEIYLSQRMTRQLLQRVGKGGLMDEEPIGTLSDRELQVFEMIGRGMTTKQIARNLNLSPKTVESHRENIKMKLDCANAAELSRRAVLWILESS
jgi:DNA-binding NarL/FixJ family response regulator